MPTPSSYTWPYRSSLTRVVRVHRRHSQYWSEALRGLNGATEGLSNQRLNELIGCFISGGYLYGEVIWPAESITPRHARRLLRNQGVPSPRSWASFGRCVRTIRRLRAKSQSIERAALETG